MNIYKQSSKSEYYFLRSKIKKFTLSEIAKNLYLLQNGKKIQSLKDKHGFNEQNKKKFQEYKSKYNLSDQDIFSYNANIIVISCKKDKIFLKVLEKDSKIYDDLIGQKNNLKKTLNKTIGLELIGDEAQRVKKKEKNY